jgi:hypothetical protein
VVKSRSMRCGSWRIERVLAPATVTLPGGKPLGFRMCLAWVKLISVWVSVRPLE